MKPPPIALLHGLGGSAERTWRHNGWIDLIEDAGRQAMGIDLLGHGDADKPTEPAAYEHMHTHLLEALPPEPVDAIGFSLGARTLLQAALQAPDRFGRLVLTGVGRNLFEPDEARRADIVDAIRGNGDQSDPFVRYFADLASTPDVNQAALQALVESSGDVFTADQLASVSMPVLVVLGDSDFAGPATPLVDALPDASFVELRNTDHFATPRSMACIDAALGFLDALPF